MPELPEVETTRLGLLKFCLGAHIEKVTMSGKKLRVVVPADLEDKLVQKKIKDIVRRGKYLIFVFEDRGTSDCYAAATHTPWLLCHLGMSGWFCVFKNDNSELPVHSHFVIALDNGYRLVFNDSRRFGLLDWCRASENEPPLEGRGEEWRQDYRLIGMGVEPLEDDFNVEYLLRRAATRKQLSIKQFVMDNAVIVGVGNIYAAEALFISRIHPLSMVSTLESEEWERVVKAIRQVLKESIEVKGTTFRDFVHADGKVGDYSELLRVYGRKNQPCKECKEPLTSFKLQARSTVYCSRCQDSSSPRKRLKVEVGEAAKTADLMNTAEIKEEQPEAEADSAPAAIAPSLS